MKTKTIVTDLTKEDIETLLETASYESCWLTFDHRDNEFAGETLEDILLNGEAIRMNDFYAEDEEDHYGSLPHVWDEEAECMCYDITLRDIRAGLAAAIDNGGYLAKCAKNYVAMCSDERNDFDITMAESLIQKIVFGEIIYG